MHVDKLEHEEDDLDNDEVNEEVEFLTIAKPSNNGLLER